MKSLMNILMPLTFVLLVAACTKKKELPEEASVSFTFDNVIDEEQLQNGGPLKNPNAAGNNYNTTTFKYIISNLVLIDRTGKEFEFNNYDIIDAFGGNQIDAVTVPNGTYETIRFTLGVDPAQNASPDPIGDLSPGGDMHFGTGQGYIFLKHEGNFLNSSNVSTPFKHHFGRDGNAITIEIPAGGLKVQGVNKTAFILCNVNSLYANPAIDFNDGPIRTSSSGDDTWVKDMKSNISNAFVFFGSYENN